MKSTVENKEITITTRVFTLELTEEEVRAIGMGLDRMTSSYVIRKNPALAGVVSSLTREVDKLLGKAEIDDDDEELEEDEDD